MKLMELVLVGYKRLMLNNIKTLKYTPTSLYQLILGTNGSGKSSVVFEASPLPANPSDYIKAGSKRSKWEHNGSVYELESNFKSGSKHSFVKDGVELNTGGTGAVQKELVRQEFRLTAEIHELLIGERSFTTMSPSARREWLTMLCDTDFSFALGVFKKLSSSARDSQGAYKHLSGRLTNETGRLKALGDSGDWASEAEQLQGELEVLFTNRSNRNLRGSGDRIKDLTDYECQVAEKMLSVKQPLPLNHDYQDHEALKVAVRQTENDLDRLQHALTWTSEALEDLLRLQSTVESSGVSDLDTAEESRVSHEASKAELLGQINQYPYQRECNAHAAIQSVESIREDLNQVLRGIPDNSDRRFNKAGVDEARAALRHHKEQLGFLQGRVAKEEATLEHIAGQCRTECPQCQHSWLPGNSDERKVLAEQMLTQFRKKVEESGHEIERLESYLEAASEFSGYFVRFRGLVSSNPSLKPFWDRLLEADGINRNPEHWVFEFSLFTQDVMTWFEIAKHDEILDRLTLAIDAMRTATGMGKLSEHIAENQQKIATLTSEIVATKHKLEALKRSDGRVSELYRLHGELIKVQEQKQVAFDDYVVELRDQHIGDLTRLHQNRLAFLNSKLSEKKAIEDLVQDIDVDRTRVGQELEVYKLLADILSPVDGLIAEQLSGFIKAFTEHLNTIIGNVWSYDMAVMPCGLDSGELDYKFPIHIKTENNVVPDISKGSTGQREIVDFAFKLIVMFYLRLTDYPLYLDELGHSFDEQHRINVMNFIKDLVETKGFSQVFMISHYASSHGAFTQAEVLVMDAANISVPMKHNQHVEMS